MPDTGDTVPIFATKALLLLFINKDSAVIKIIKGKLFMSYFENVKKNFGFGCMRLPMKDGEVNMQEFSQMVDMFMDQGFNYFDTAHVYIGGKSETAIREAVSKRYPREKFILTDKLTSSFFNTEDEIRPFFNSQLAACGVDYFDFYLMHAQNKSRFEKYKRCRAYEQALRLKAEGKIKHFGISFHDTAEVLDEILFQYPQIEVVQIQFNYLDYDDPAVQARSCYDVCRKHGKPIIVMEPVRGGNLVNLPDKAGEIFNDLHGGSPASYAIRFAAGFDGIFMVWTCGQLFGPKHISRFLGAEANQAPPKAACS